MKKNFSLNAKSIRARARTINLPRQVIDDVVSQFLKWHHANGPEWAVSRMKDIKAAVVYQYATGTAPKGLWIKYTRNGNKLGGTWGFLVEQMRVSRKRRKAVLQLLTISSSVIAREVTPKQREKFVSSATRVGKPVPSEYSNMLATVAQKYRVPKLGRPRDLVSSPKRRKSHEKRMLIEFYEFFFGDQAIQLVHDLPSGVWEEIIQPTLGPLLGTGGSSEYHDRLPFIGEIQYTQEHGHKCRFFASPHLWIQQCLDPLKKGLLNLLKQVPWDGTHDQAVADEAILSSLAAGQTVHCFDLSDATNVFPLELQSRVVRSVLSKADQVYMDLFEEIAKLPWKFEGQPLHFARGQALGLGPSFPMFALTHGLLLLALNKRQHDNKYFVIGDDVVILDDALAEAYEKALTDLDLPFSPLKTLRSSKIAEFAGFVFTPDGGKFQTVKWKGAKNENLLDMIRLNGLRFIETTKRDLQPFLNWYSRLPEPLGLGFNPEGRSLDERLAGVESLFWIDEKEPQGQYDLDVWKRVSDRIYTLPNHIAAHIQARWERDGKLRQLRLADQAAKVEASKVFSHPLAKELVSNGNTVGRLIRQVDTNGVVNLPLATPVKFVWKQTEKPSRFRSVKKALLPFYQQLQEKNV